jgi:hypothetical protein
MTEKKKAPGATGAGKFENEIVANNSQFTTPTANSQSALRAALEMAEALAADDLETWQAAWEAYLDSFTPGGAS